MSRIGIVTCSNCTQDLDCASLGCLADIRRRRGFFEQYPPEEPLELVGIINCSGCPTVNAQAKILRRVRSIAEFGVDAIHLSYCVTALCPFTKKYSRVIREAYPEITLVMGTHPPGDPKKFQAEVKEMLCASRYNMADLIKKHEEEKS